MGIRERYPLLYAFGDRATFLNHEDAIKATANERIQSIWPFINGRVLVFQRTLTKRERTNWDHEDTLLALVVALLQKDAGWNPEKGKYITFAGAVIEHEMYAIRDTTRTVHSPRNSCCRIKEYAAEEATGEISDRRRKTANDIRRTQSGIRGIATKQDPEYQEVADLAVNHAPDAAMLQDEDDNETRATIIELMKHLEPHEALVMGSLYGLWGQPRKTLAKLAWETGLDPLELAQAKTTAVAKIRRNPKRRPPTPDLNATTGCHLIPPLNAY